MGKTIGGVAAIAAIILAGLYAAYYFAVRRKPAPGTAGTAAAAGTLKPVSALPQDATAQQLTAAAGLLGAAGGLLENLGLFDSEATA